MLPARTVAAASGAGGADIMFVIDTGFSMMQYNPAMDDSLADALVGVIEQAPGGSLFGVATEYAAVVGIDAYAATNELYNMPEYGCTCDIQALLQNAAATFTGSGMQQIIVVSTSQWYDIVDDALQLESQGTIVYIIAFEQDEAAAEQLQSSYPHAFVCANAREVSYRIAGLYEEIVEIPP